MSSASSSRLERALDLYCAHQQQGGDLQQLLARHPDLADLLAAFAEPPEPAAPGAGGERLDDFELLHELGRGAVGTVHAARQISLDRRVAVKVLHAPLAGDPTALARFHREAHVLARLDHPGIVRVFAASTVAARPWLAMELVDGTSLANHLDELRRTGHHGGSLRRLVAAIARIAEALHHAHAAGIVHRDVKPSNILMRSNGDVVLGDFGLARDATAPTLTRTGIAAGTPHYMAPEQVLGDATACDARSDVFALGASLYECLTLRRAFDGTNTQDVLQAILHRDPTDVRRLVRGLPVALAAIVHMAIEKRPERRYQSAQAFADDLRAFLDLQPIVARPPSATRRLLRLVRSRPMVAALLLVLGAGVAFTGAFAWQWPQLRAAAAVARNEQFEDALVVGTLARTGSDAEACYAHFRRAMALAPERVEGLAGLCYAIGHYAGPQAALDELERLAPPGPSDLDISRVMFLRQLQRVPEAEAIERRLAPPTTPLGLWLSAAPLLHPQADRAALQRADRLLSLAVRTAPRPRLLLHVQWAALQLLLNDPAGRRESAEALLLLWPDHPVALQAAGSNLLATDAARALTLLQRAIELGNTHPLARVNLGTAQVLTGRAERAVATLAAVLPDPGLTDDQRMQVMRLVHVAGDDAIEARLCAEWLQREPRSLGARNCAARLATRTGDHDRAVALFRACVADAPHDFDQRWDLAFACSQAGELDSAADVARELVRERPTHERSHALLLDILESQQEPELALAETERWATANPDDAAAWHELAGAMLQWHDPTASARALAAAERADYLSRGEVRDVLLRRAEALEQLDRGVEAASLRARAATAPTASLGTESPR